MIIFSACVIFFVLFHIVGIHLSTFVVCNIGLVYNSSVCSCSNVEQYVKTVGLAVQKHQPKFNTNLSNNQPWRG